MTEQVAKSYKNGKHMIILGFVVIAILFVMYSRYQNSELLVPGAIESLHRLAYGFYIALFVAFGAIACGAYMYHKTKYLNRGKDLLSIIAYTTWNQKSRKIFVATFIGYGVFFSLVSGTLVYQPEINFSIHYGAEIPSGFIAPCCDELGYMPKIIIYLTEHVGLQIIPINLVLQVVVSYLVALNAAISINMISKREGSVGTVGAVTGLFIACPTCAGTLSSVFIGTASGIALSVALSQLQTLFIGISIPILLVTPFIMAKKLGDNSCKIN